ncbi:hypothetical protein P8A22_38100 (plasmid) [Streptomyces laculatispora]|uniref:Uncharacterized protein n=1 Tax=Streptomyces laculatispora TaxID=887464 RepID=A0ABY9IFD6_9ACTN|nr:hypothetical protein [Streptomyces laculatispora]WLQ45637.1 hypothetical protein P8A22_38100 [Streptomyces laculatispora]
MTHIYAFRDINGQWHGDPDAAPANPADKPSRGWLTYQPVPGTPEADSPFAGQTLAVLYGVTELEPGPVIYQLDSGGRFQATWYVHTLLATPVGSAVIPPQRLDQPPTPSLENSLTQNGRLYALTATRDANGNLTTEITVTNNHGEIQAELRGTLNLTDLQPLARLLHATTPNPAPPTGSHERTWSPADSTRLANRFCEERDFGVLSEEFNCRRNDVYRRLLELELIAPPAQRRPGQPTQPQPAPTPSPVLQQRRLQHSNSHARWTEQEEAELARHCANGASVAQLSQEFGRSELAIESRLLKIGAEGPAADLARFKAL